MKKINSLILLIHSLSKAEKKSIYLHSNLTKGTKVYMELFNLIDGQKIVDGVELQKEFKEQFSKASFHPVASYLYDFILGILVRIKSNQDKNFELYQNILAAKVLQERNLDSEYYEMLQQLKEEAQGLSDYHSLLTIKRMELDYLRTNEFQNISEKALQKKQHKTNDTLKTLRQINEQSALYELLQLRVQKTSSTQLEANKQFFNDLVVSEISLVSNLNRDVFEVQKLHQLFQAQYLIFVGDYRSALNAFIELDKLFEKNQKLWNNPPLYYARVLEGILTSLRGIKAYDKMDYFLDKLKALKHPSITFQTELACVRFVNSVAPYMRKGDYKICKKMMEEYDSELISKFDLLTPFRYLQLCLCLSIIYLGNGETVKARKQMTQIINGDHYAGLSLFRPMQLINLVIHYELGDVDIITSRLRSIKRQNRLQKMNSRLENILFHFLSVNLISLSANKKESLKKKINEEFDAIEKNNEERRLMGLFDFRGWMLKWIK